MGAVPWGFESPLSHGRTYPRNQETVQIDIEQPQSWSRRLRITVPADQVERERRQVAAQVAKRMKLPGFRKGKVPASMVEKQYGGYIAEQTMERVVNNAYRQALQEQGFNPISQAQVENVDWEPGSDLKFEAEFEVQPEIELSQLGGFEVSRPASEIEDAQVDRVIERLREEHASWTPAETGKPGEGDRVSVEITPLQGDEADRPEPRQYEVVLGTGEILEDIDHAIRTLEIGGEGEFTIELPEQEGEAPEEEHRIHLKLLGIEHPELPEADDAFAAKVGEFEDLATLRARVREDLEEEAGREADREVRRQLMSKVLEANPFDVPPSMVEQYVDGLIQAPEDADPAEVEQAKSQARPAAEYAVRRMLVIDRIAQMESLSATEEDVDARVQEIAERNEMDAGQVRRQLAQSGRLRGLAADLTEARVFDYLKSLSTIEEENE